MRTRYRPSLGRSLVMRSPLDRFPGKRLLLIVPLSALMSGAAGSLAGRFEGQVRLVESPTLTVCEAIQRPEVGGGEKIRVRGRVVSGYETFALSSDACPADDRAAGMIWLETPGAREIPYARCASPREFIEIQQQGRTAEFVGGLEWFQPLPVEFHSDSNWARLQKFLKKTGSASATIVGRLDHEENSRVVRDGDGSYGVTRGYGHLNGFSRRIVIERVEDVKRDQR